MKAIISNIEHIINKHQITNLEIREKDWCFTLHLAKKYFKEIIRELKNSPQTNFSILTDLTASDYPSKSKRFEVVYNLLSITENIRILIKVDLEDGEEIETISDLYAAANWYEREVWDMFGINFIHHPDLRRILTDYGFIGHPLRKDFPLTGYQEVRYDYEQKKVIYEPVSLTQEYRVFDFETPWDGPGYVLPGDEKAEKKND